MQFIADLHIHSKYSRATAKHLDLEQIHINAQKKGVTVVATGDFTHPAWFSEIQENLIPLPNGLFQLNDPLSRQADPQVPASCRNRVHFILSCEISNIYKKNGRVRKNHNLVFFPSLESAKTFNRKLEKIGNIRSDGRPILGLDARDLLEIVLEVSESAFLIPAHIWTPWFSLFGSKSGFDSLHACFEDLTAHIFALETGLSSDPEMNWRVSGLDGLKLVSNSDAHSPEKIGREANLFDTELSFSGIRSALMDKEGLSFKGTVEFFPEEGKYHLDGHRKCGIRLHPEETRKLDGRCPECGGPLTLGVLHRVYELADREKEQQPDGAPEFHRLIPLVEILSELLGVGPASKKVIDARRRLIEAFGPELFLLQQTPLDALEKVDIPLFKEALRCVRHEEIVIQPGYDGEFGKIRIFTDAQRRALLGQRSLFGVGAPEVALEPEKKRPEPDQQTGEALKNPVRRQENRREGIVKATLNREQRQAVQCPAGPILVVAGPGTGKTHTLTRRILHRIQTEKVPADAVLAITFTQKAAVEMKARLLRMINGVTAPRVATFHGFCLSVLKETGGGNQGPPVVIDETDRRLLVLDAIRMHTDAPSAGRINPDAVLNRIVSTKQRLDQTENADSKDPDPRNGPRFRSIYHTYQKLLRLQGLLDYEDLIATVVTRFENDASLVRVFQQRHPHLFIDEYQDINYAQYRLIRLMYPGTDPERDLFVIGDPDQAIYGFRGSDIRFFKRFCIDYPGTTRVVLKKNYRSTPVILKASKQILPDRTRAIFRRRRVSGSREAAKIEVRRYSDEKQEAEGITKIIETLVGGTGYFFVDSGRAPKNPEERLRAFSDLAVLFRTKKQGEILAETLENKGIPYQTAQKTVFLRGRLAEICSVLKMIHNKGTFADFERACALLGIGIEKQALLQLKYRCLNTGVSLQQELKRLSGPIAAEVPTDSKKIVSTGCRKIQELRNQLSGLTVARQLVFLAEKHAAGINENGQTQPPEAYERLLGWADAYGADTGTAAFLDSLALLRDADVWDERAQKVSLLTLHAAKGLEFPVVFVAGCEDGLIPHFRGKHPAQDLEEERRLFYVAVTRAKERLFLSWAGKRRHFGGVSDRRISPFVLAIQKNLVQYKIQAEKEKKGRGHTQLPLFH